MPRASIGVIGGSGLYRMEQMTNVEEVNIHTPFGDPSDAITIGNVAGVSMAFLPRHGRGHRLSPSVIPVRANIWALKSLGVEWVISVSAVGSLRADVAPRDLIIPDQLFDRTKSRVNSFFEQGLVVHCTFADPFCPTLSSLLLASARSLPGVHVHSGGTYVCMELAREAELCYATIACATDYDSWHETEEAVTVEMVIGNLSANVANAQRILLDVAQKIPADRAHLDCTCASALATSIITDRAAIPAEAKERYDLLIGKYLP